MNFLCKFDNVTVFYKRKQQIMQNYHDGLLQTWKNYINSFLTLHLLHRLAIITRVVAISSKYSSLLYTLYILHLIYIIVFTSIIRHEYQVCIYKNVYGISLNYTLLKRKLMPYENYIVVQPFDNTRLL